VVEKHEGWQLTAGTKVTAHATYDDCKAALVALGAGATGKCKDVTALTVEATCEDVPMPIFPTVVDEHGFTVRPGVVVERKPDSEDWEPTKMEGFVKGPDWALGKNCWVPGLVPYDETYHAPDGPPDNSPGPWVYLSDPEWPIGGKCPAQLDGKNDPHLCHSPPNPPIPPAP
jgi:hypothetical protein